MKLASLLTLAAALTAASADNKVVFGDPGAGAGAGQCSTVGGPGAGQPCHFPFTFRGVARDGCITDFDPEVRPSDTDRMMTRV